MPHTITRRINARSLSLLFIFVGLQGLMALASGPLNLSRTTAHAGGSNGPTTGLALSSGAAAQSPGAISFSSDNYSVSESASGATITLKRAGGTDNKVSAKVTLTDVTTSPADYVFAPGALDDSFDPAAGTFEGVSAMALQPDGRVVISGLFTVADGTATRRIARLNPDGSLDASFKPVPVVGHGVATAVVQPDGKIIIGGLFTQLNGTTRNNIARLNPNGSLDASFNPGKGTYTEETAEAFHAVNAMALQPDGRIVIVGTFTKFNGTPRNRIARLNPNGSLDTSFNPGTGANLQGGGVNTTVVQPDGKIIIGGLFISVNGTGRNNIARLNADGSHDTSFNPGTGAHGSVSALTLQPDGRIIVGGDFTSFNRTTRHNIARLHSNGALDASFNKGADPNINVWTAVVQPDGKIIIGGAAIGFNSPRAGVARLNPDGSPDASFDPGTGSYSQVSAAALRPDGRIVISGLLFNADDTIRPGVARLTGDLFVTWAAGDGSDKTIYLPVVNDSVADTGESLTLTLTPLTGGATAGTNPTAALTIVERANRFSSVQGTGVFGGTATLTATLGPGNVVTAGRRVIFSLNGNPVGAATTDAGGVATLAGVKVSGINAGAHGSAVRVSFAGDPNVADSITGLLSVSPANQTITFGPLPNRTFGDADFPVSATASSGLSVSFTATGSCTVTDGTVHITGGGSCTVTASQDGDSNYNMAPKVSRSFSIARARQTIAFGPLADKTYGAPPFELSATASSGLDVGFAAAGNCAVSGATLHITGAGSCTVTASVGGSPDYHAATAVRRSFLIAKAATTATISSSANPSAAGQSVTFTASVGSAAGEPTGSFQLKVDGADLGAPVRLGVGGAVSVTSSPLTQGSHTVTAVYSGDANFAASSATLSGGQWVHTFSVTANSKVEGHDGRSAMDFRISLAPAAVLPITVNYATSSGTADASSDYEAASGQLFFLPGQTSKLVTIKIIGDTEYEEAEDFFVDISAPVLAELGRGRGLILNDDPSGGVIEFEQSSYDVAEGGSLTVKVKRTVQHSLPVDVVFTSSEGSPPPSFLSCSATTGLARGGCDFNWAMGTLHFAPGETEKSFKVLISDDSYVEGAETLYLSLRHLAGKGVVGPKSEAIVTINDDSPETGGNPIDDANNFVRQQYLDFLGRDPDAAGLRFWAGGITTCGADAACREAKRVDTSAAFFLSIEFQETGYLVYRTYKAAYGDALSPNVEGTVPVVPLDEFLPNTRRIGQDVVVGVGAWEQQLEANKQAYVLEFVQRLGFLTAFPASMSAEEFVSKLDENAGGVLTAGEKAQLVSALGAAPGDAVKRASALRQVAENAQLKQRELNRAFVLMQYFGYLRRNPDAAPDADFRGWKFWLDKLDQFGGDYRQAEMVRAFISSIEYRKRFGQ